MNVTVKFKWNILTEEENEQINKRFKDALLIACASTIKSYCEESKCDGCPFHDENFKVCNLRDFVPAYWELPNIQEDEE